MAAAARLSGPEVRPAPLLAALASLTRLNSLQLSTPGSWEERHQPPQDAALYTALTASGSSLESLSLDWDDLPVGALEQMLSSKPLPRLRSLTVKGGPAFVAYADEAGTPAGNVMEEAQGVMSINVGPSASVMSAVNRLKVPLGSFSLRRFLRPADVQAVADNCPALEQLTLEPPLMHHSWRVPGVDTATNSLDSLKQLTALTRLHAHSSCGDADFQIASLAKLTTLRDLQLGPTCDADEAGVTVPAVMKLTALRQLTSLQLKHMWYRKTYGPFIEDEFYIDFQTPVGSPPDVWKQLQRCGKAALRQRAR